MQDDESYAATYLNNALTAKDSGVKEIAMLREAIKFHNRKAAEARAKLKAHYLSLLPDYDDETEDDLRLQSKYIREDLLKDTLPHDRSRR